MLKMRAEDEVLLVEKRGKLVGFILGLSELVEYPVPDRLIQAFLASGDLAVTHSDV